MGECRQLPADIFVQYHSKHGKATEDCQLFKGGAETYRYGGSGDG